MENPWNRWFGGPRSPLQGTRGRFWGWVMLGPFWGCLGDNSISEGGDGLVLGSNWGRPSYLLGIWSLSGAGVGVDPLELDKAQVSHCPAPVSYCTHMSSPIRLLGEHPALLDPEGRIQLPLALRDEWNHRKSDFALMANLEPDGSLCLRLREDWDSFTEDLRRSPGLSPRARQTLLLYAAHSSPVRCDKSWRIRVPDTLLELIGVDRKGGGQRDVVVVGNFDDVRLWSKEGWQSFRASARDEYAAGMDELLNGKPLGPEGLVQERLA